MDSVSFYQERGYWLHKAPLFGAERFGLWSSHLLCKEPGVGQVKPELIDASQAEVCHCRGDNVAGSLLAEPPN